MISRRALMTTTLAAGAAAGLPRARAAGTPGVTATTIKIGNTMPYSGPASSYSVIGKAESAYFKMINDQGGVHGHKVDFISVDDSYSPPKTVEDIRRLVEQDQVDFTFQTLGTPCNSAIAEYMNHKKIPQLFVGSGASKWANYKKYPWTMGFQPSYRTEAQIYAKYIKQEIKDPKIGILFQNDDFGKDYPDGMRDVLGNDWDKLVVKTASYETTDPTVESQIVELKSTGANVILIAAIPKFAAQAIRKVHDLDWKPHFFLTNVSISVGGVMEPAGPQNSVGIITTGYLKDPTDPGFKDDPGMKQWRDFMAKYMPEGNVSDAFYVFAYAVTATMIQVLNQCDGDFSRPNVMKQAESLHDFELPVLLPGIKMNTSKTDHRPIDAMQLMRWDGKTWVRFGNLIEGVAA